jgi:sulfide:quinone oxidoreductase
MQDHGRDHLKIAGVAADTHPSGCTMSRFSVVVCGGGIAGMEAVLRLRRLAGDQIDITVVSPSDTLVYRPLAVLEPFGAALVHRYPVARIVSDTGVRWIRAGLDWVDRAAQIAHAGAEDVPYDALLLAIGGHELPPPAGVFVFSDRTAPAYREVLEQTWSGAISRIAFVTPAEPSWPLPIYELALLTAARAGNADNRPEIILGEPGPRPLAAFGREASDAITELLANANISVYTRSEIRHQDGPLLHTPAGDLRPDLIVTVPHITGPNVRGIAGDALDRFLHVDEHCRVTGAGGRIYSAGDATHLPVKQGGVGAQQADTAAASIVHLAGLGPKPEPLHPVIRGVLLTGGQPLYLTAHLIAGEGVRAQVARTPPWPIDDKIVAEELSVYLAELNAAMDADERMDG